MPTFTTPDPVALRIRNAAGRVDVHPVADVTETTIELTALNDAGGRAIETATIVHDGDTIVVDIPDRHGLLGRSPQVAVDVRLPAASRLDVAAGSATITVGHGLAALTATSGSGDVRFGDVTGGARVSCGSGDVTGGTVGGPLDVTTGSGDVQVVSGEAGGKVVTGSGDVHLGAVVGAVATKTGSGDVTIDQLDGELDAKTGSGDTRVARARRGSIGVRAASGDVAVGVAAGTAAWLDLSSVSGEIDQHLDERAAPDDDQPRLALTITTISGDIAVRRA